VRYFKATFVWVIALVALAGYTYLDFSHTRIEEARKEEASRLLPFTPQEALAIELVRAEGVIALERWEDGWRLVAPIKAKADSEAVEKFLEYVTDSRNDADYVMDPDPTPERLKEFGLAEPKVTLTLKVGKELKPYTLMFGDRAPSMGVAFARLKGGKPVYRVLANARAEADKDAFYFRDKKVLRLNPVMVDQLAITRADLSLRARMTGEGRWTLERPVKDRADNEKVFEFLGLFANAQVKAFADETKDRLREFALDKPSAELRFWLSGDAEPAVTLTVGARSPERRGYYCAMSDRDGVFVLDEEVIHAIPRDARELRGKELFFFEQDALARIEMRAGGTSVALVRGADKEWRRGGGKGDVVEYLAIKEFLDALASVRIRDFITDDPASLKEYGLDTPALQVMLYPEGSAVPLFVSVGARTPAGHRYARTGERPTILALDETIQGILQTLL